MLPYLRVQLTSHPLRLELIVEACERAVRNVPAAWRCRDAKGARAECAAPLYDFVRELGDGVLHAELAVRVTAMLREFASRE